MGDTRKYYKAYDDRYRQVHNESLKWFSEEHSEIVTDVVSKYQIELSAKILEIGCNNLEVVEQGITSIEPDFPMMMYAVVKRKGN